MYGDSEKNLGIAFALNLGFVVVEIIGGILTNSVAILSDALHDFGDSLSLGISWVLEKYSKRESNSRYTYGFKRLSLLGAIINSIILLVGSVFIIKEALPRVFHPESVSAKGMFFLAILGIIINGAAFLRLRNGVKISERVVSLHLLEDLMGWVAVLIVGFILMFFDWPILDPILSLCISIFVLKNVYSNLKEIMNVFLQAIPETYDLMDLEEKIVSSSELVEEIHNVHLWTLDGITNIMSFHLVVEENLSIDQIVALKKEIKSLLQEMGIQDVSIDIENLNNCSTVASSITAGIRDH